MGLGVTIFIDFLVRAGLASVAVASVGIAKQNCEASNERCLPRAYTLRGQLACDHHPYMHPLQGIRGSGRACGGLGLNMGRDSVHMHVG